MSKFTKGEWEYGKNGKFPFWYVGVKGTSRYLATVDKEANARLIAAAPEMYRLLQEFMKIDEQKKWAASEKNDPAYMMALVAQDGAVNMSKELLARIDDEEAHS